MIGLSQSKVQQSPFLIDYCNSDDRDLIYDCNLDDRDLIYDCNLDDGV